MCSSGPKSKCQYCGEFVTRGHLPRHEVYCEEKNREKKMIDELQAEFTHLGKVVRKNRAAFCIDGKRIKIISTDQKYYKTGGDENARYISFRFVCGPGTTTEGSKFVITHHAFTQKATLYEEPLQERFVTIGQLMQKKGEAPCLEGCRAIFFVALKISSQSPEPVSWGRDRYIMEITKVAMSQGSWSHALSTNDLFQGYKKSYKLCMPYSFLRWMAECMGMTVMSGLYEDVGPNSKSYALLCRQLGIRL